MDFEKFKRRLQDIDTPEEMCNTLNDIIDKEIIKNNDDIYLKLLLSQKDNDFIVLLNYLGLFEKEKEKEKLFWEAEKKNKQVDFTQMDGITRKNYLMLCKICKNNICNITNQINTIKFAQKYLTEKIKTLNEAINQPDNSIKHQITEEAQTAGIKKETTQPKESIQNYCAYNRKDEQYMIKYLDELNDIFHFNDPKTQKKTFGAVCLILLEKKENNKHLFKDINFTHLAGLLSTYWNFPFPTDIRKNKYKSKADELKKAHSVLFERQLL